MTTNDTRAAFEAWAAKEEIKTTKWDDGSYLYISTVIGWGAYQAALASPEVQALRKDADRLNFMISEECQIQSLSTPNEVRHRLGWPDYGEAQSEWFTNPRAAIDAAMEKQECRD